MTTKTTATTEPINKPNNKSMRDARRKRNERGEGVISLAIGVLIMAFLGAGMWVAFNSTMDKAQTSVDAQVTKIGG